MAISRQSWNPAQKLYGEDSLSELVNVTFISRFEDATVRKHLEIVASWLSAISRTASLISRTTQTFILNFLIHVLLGINQRPYLVLFLLNFKVQKVKRWNPGQVNSHTVDEQPAKQNDCDEQPNLVRSQRQI